MATELIFELTTPPMSVAAESAHHLLSVCITETCCLSKRWERIVGFLVFLLLFLSFQINYRQFLRPTMPIRRPSVNAEPEGKDEALLAELGYK